MHIFNSNLNLDAKLVKGEGPYLFNSVSDRFFDCWLGSGTLIFGHEQVIESNMQSNWLLPDGPKVSNSYLDLLSKIVDFKIGSLGFQTSGSSAVHRACRVARAVTGKSKVAVFNLFWHGSDDSFLFVGERKKKLSEGISDSAQENVSYFDSIDQFFEQAKLEEFAAILVEPYQGSDPSVSVLDAISTDQRNKLLESNVLLVIDEVITGFRSQYGSCSSSRKLQPDIVVFGKAIASGFPTGLVVVSDRLTTPVKEKSIFWGGTFGASPIQLEMVEKSLIRLSSLNYEILDKNLKDIIKLIDELVKEFDLKVSSGGGFGRLSSISSNKENASSRGFIGGEKENINKAKKVLLDNKIFLNHNLLIFPSIFNIYDKMR